MKHWKDPDAYAEENIAGDFSTQPQGHYSENRCYKIGIFQIVPRGCIQKFLVFRYYPVHAVPSIKLLLNSRDGILCNQVMKSAKQIFVLDNQICCVVFTY